MPVPVTAQGPGFLSPMWDPWMEFLAPTFSLALAGFCRHVGSKPAVGESLSQKAFPHHSAFQINVALNKNRHYLNA